MNNNERVMHTPYKTLESKKNNPSKHFLMLSELIDNSIGSWETNKMEDDLSIILTINYKNRVINCLDNAFGMSSNELLDSVELNIEKHGNKMNLFGVGMKNAAFWFGEDLIIKTRNQQESNMTFIKLSEKKDNLNEPIKWKIENSMKPLLNRGTQISIKNVYKNRIQNTTDIHETIEILETKYKKFLIGSKNGKINISIEVTFKNGSKSNFALEGKPTLSQIIDRDNKGEFIERLSDYIKPNGELIITNFYEKIKNKVENNEELLFEQKIEFSDKKIMFELGIIAQENNGKITNDFKSKYGITAYQNNRAIKMSSKYKRLTNPLEFDINYTRTNIKRVFGFVELGHIFKPDNNKSDFNYGEDKDLFMGILKKIGTDMEKLANCVHDVIGIKRNVKPGNINKNSIAINKQLNTKFKNFNFDNTNSKTNQMTFYDASDKKWEVTYIEYSSEQNNDFIEATNDKGIRKVLIKFNINHYIWKPLTTTTNKINLKSVIYPLVIILGLTQLGLDQNLTKEWFGYNEEINYLKIIKMFLIKGMKK